MARMTGHHKIAYEICKALGIEHAKSLDIHMAVGEMVTCTVTFNADSKDMEKLPGLLKKFELVPIVDIDDTTTLGQEIASFDFKTQDQ